MADTGGRHDPPHNSGDPWQGPAKTGARSGDNHSSPSGKKQENERSASAETSEQVPPTDPQQSRSQPGDGDADNSSPKPSRTSSGCWNNDDGLGRDVHGDPLGPSRWSKTVVGNAGYLLKQHGLLAALQSKKLSALDKTRCVLFFVMGLVILPASTTFFGTPTDFVGLRNC